MLNIVIGQMETGYHNYTTMKKRNVQYCWYSSYVHLIRTKNITSYCGDFAPTLFLLSVWTQKKQVYPLALLYYYYYPSVSIMLSFAVTLH